MNDDRFVSESDSLNAAIIEAAAELIRSGYANTNGLITLEALRYRIVGIIGKHVLGIMKPSDVRRACEAIGPHHGDRCSGGRVQCSNAQFTENCRKCDGTGEVK